MPLSTSQTNDINKQFDPLRNRAKQQEAANLQNQQQALARRFASMGGGPGGAQVKQEQVAADQSAQRLASANEGIDAQQQGALNQAREAQAGRDFQTSERLGAQKFASGESALQRRFQTSERLGSQDFARGERLGSQDFAHNERLGAQDFQQGQFDKTFDEQKRQYDQDFAMNKNINAINSILSMWNSDVGKDQIGALLNQLGFDIGAIPGLTSDDSHYRDQTPATTAAAPANGAPPGTKYKHKNNHTGQVYYDNNPQGAIKWFIS